MPILETLIFSLLGSGLREAPRRAFIFKCYDAADQLASVTLPNSTNITYGYDADGRRVKQTVGSTVTNYLWDEASTYGDVVLETNGTGSTLASYVLGSTGLISQTRGSTTSYFLGDGQGSTRALTNSSGVITDTYSYKAFGELFSQTGTTVNPYLYTGQQFDSLTGLYDLRARYYNPTLGRFLSQDTYPVNFNNPVELNRYVYVANDPINGTDPSGRSLFDTAVLKRNAIVVGTTLAPVGLFLLRTQIRIAYYFPGLVPWNVDNLLNWLQTAQLTLRTMEDIIVWLQTPRTPPTPPSLTPTETQSTETQEPGKVIVELRAGDYSNAMAKAQQGSIVYATNLKADWRSGKEFYEFGLSPQEYPQIGIYLGWHMAKERGLIVGDMEPIENQDVPSGIGDLVYSIYPYPSEAFNFGVQAARIASLKPGTVIAVTEGGSGSSLLFEQGFNSVPERRGSKFKVSYGALYGFPNPTWPENGTWVTREYVVP